MHISQWHNCYDENLKALITPESFAHPAKMAKRLCERIFEYGEAAGYWSPGDAILDPFGGIGTTALIGAYRGYRVVSVELEPRFVELHRANIEKNRSKLERLHKPLPVVIRGDCRIIIEKMAYWQEHAEGSIFFPPYNLPMSQDHNGTRGGKRGTHQIEDGAFAKYGSEPGQIEGLSAEGFDQVIGSIFSPPYADGSASEITGVDDTPARRQSTKKSRPQRERGYSFAGAVSSPPYAESIHDGNGIDPDKLTGNPAGKHSQAFAEGYGQTAGQIGALREGDFASVAGAVTSPPYEDQPIEKNSKSIDLEKQYQTYRSQGGGASFESFVRTQQLHSQGYGQSDGQIGTLHGGDFEQVVGAVTSPPYEASVNQSDGANDANARLERKAAAGVDVTQAVNRGGPNSILNQAQVYGSTTGQIGAESGETYWQAMRQVYTELHAVLKPGGVAAVVVKDFVRNKQIVPLCDRTAQLLHAIGFTVVERTHAMLVKETHAGLDLFSGEPVTKKVERKSFFRRLAEKNGSPRIDYEEVIWARKSPSNIYTGTGR